MVRMLRFKVGWKGRMFMIKFGLVVILLYCLLCCNVIGMLVGFGKANI